MGSSIVATCESLGRTTARLGALELGSQFAKFPIVFFSAVARARLPSGRMGTLFWFNTAVGAALTVAVLALMTPMFLPAGLSAQHRALLRRQMRFGTVAVCELVALTAATVAGLTAALHGAGDWALVCLYLLIEFTQTILAPAAMRTAL